MLILFLVTMILSANNNIKNDYSRIRASRVEHITRSRSNNIDIILSATGTYYYY